jgi:protein NrfD
LLALNTASRAASGFLLGAVLCSMLLGHYYLTAPAMTVAPLKRTIALIAWGLAARSLLAGIGWSIARAGLAGHLSSTSDQGAMVLFFGRWGMGFAAAGIATYMTWKTAQIRSTQSATGILYITMIFVLFGELSSLVLSGRYGVIC